MAYLKRDTQPSDAVRISELEAVTFQWDIVSNWNKFSESWALRYASGILGAACSISGIYINNHYRTKLRLSTYGQFASLIPMVMLPGMFSGMFHRQLISTEILLEKKANCAVCYELQSAAIQFAFGLSYPTVLAAASALMLANRYSTYRVPSLSEKPKELFKFVIKITRPISGSLATITFIQLSLSSILTYYELKNYATIKQKVLEIEKKIDTDNNAVMLAHN